MSENFHDENYGSFFVLLEGKKNKEKKKMYCRKCGARMSEQDRFCPECGTEASKGNTQQDELNGFPGNEQPQENPRMNKKTVIWIWILAAWILLIAIGISAFFIVKGQHVKKQYQSSLEAGDKYLENLDYEKAEDAYLQAIKISPKEKESYEKLIQYYVDHNEIDKAKKIVKKAKKNLPKSESKKIEEKQKEWESLEEYTWVVEPTIEADEIYYLQGGDFFEYSANEMRRQMDSKYAVIKKGDSYGLIGMDGKLLEGMAYKSVKTENKYYSVILKEEKYDIEKGDMEQLYYLNDSDEMIPGSSLIGDPEFAEKGMYYYTSNEIRNSIEDEIELYDREWRKNYISMPEVAIPVKETEETMADEITEGKTEDRYEFIDSSDSGYGIWDEDKMTTKFIYDECGSESSGLLAVEKDGKWGYVNDQGKVMIPIKYDASWKHYNETNGDKEKEFCYAATEGYVPLVKDGKWEMRNSKGDLVISSGAFEEILPVYDGKCWVKKDGKWGILKLENAKIDKDSEKEDSSDTQKVSNKNADKPGNTKKENGSSQDDKKTISSETYQKVYGPLLDQAGNEYGQSMDYFLYDIDKDGVKELLLLNGTCEADYVYKIYTIGNGSARYIDEVNGSCVMFYEDENGGTEKYIISVQARMGCERVSKIWLKDGKVSTEEISYKEEVGIDEDYYSNPYPLDYADVTDKSLLK